MCSSDLGVVNDATRPVRARAAAILGTREVDVPLTVEVSDTPDDPGHARARLLFARSPVTLADCLEEPGRYTEVLRRGYLDFGRGFLGADLARHLRDAVAEARLRFPAVIATWRGEPLLHPALAEVLDALRAMGPVHVVTSGALLVEGHRGALRDVELWVTGEGGATAERLGARRGRPAATGPAVSWEGRVTRDVGDVALARRIGDVLREPFGAIWGRR
mgnify:FL=1